MPGRTMWPMTDPFVPRVGAVLSADIAVPEHDRVRRFYAAVLRTGERPRWGENLMNDLGLPIIGVGERVEAYEHLPLQWMPHIQVASVGTSVEKALSLGGRELMHDKNDEGNSQWAVVADPNGAAFGLIPVSPALPPPSDDAEVAARASAGRIAWLDLTVPDAGTTRDFYREVVGWSAQGQEMKDAGETYDDYCMQVGGDAVAGVCHARGVNTGLPAVWVLYLPVGDLEQSVHEVEAGGGEVVKASLGADGTASSVVIRDPVGACLALVPG